MPMLASIRMLPSGGCRRFPCRSSAGRETTSAGFEQPDGTLGGGLAATGNYPGKARTADELRRDAEKALVR